MSTYSKLYFECHVTIEPVFDDQLELASKIAARNKFRVADLLMQKRKEDKETRSKYDTFMTGRHQCYEILEANMKNLIQELNQNGLKVWRYKIEDTVMDSKIEDILELL